MPITDSLPVCDLCLDPDNFRTVRQPDEIQAVQAMIAIRPDRFWALMHSLLDDGYLPTENILVLKSVANPPLLTVMEGNRRIAALKVLHGFLPRHTFRLPDDILGKINGLSNEWRTSNEKVPCTIYEPAESATVYKVVSLAHAKGEKAGRDHWTAVARARHNRDKSEASEPGLDLLEKYLREGKNLSAQQAERWAGDFPLSVLDEAIKKIATRFGSKNAPDLAKQYPTILHRDALEAILFDIGLKEIGFPKVRRKDRDFAAKYGVPDGPSSGIVSDDAAQPNSSQGATATAEATTGYPTGTASSGNGQAQRASAAETNTTLVGATNGSASGQGHRAKAVSVTDPRAVKRSLKEFKPVGQNRTKVVALRDEALQLDLEKTPLAFCFLLRSMFEISAKAYCEDRRTSSGLKATQKDGKDRKLVDLLRDITADLSNGMRDQATIRELHGALTELAKSDGILSVTSMNQLVHNPSFSVTSGDISTMFGNIVPLLKAMNE